MKCLEEIIGYYLLGFAVGKYLLNRTKKALTIKNNILDIIEINTVIKDMFKTWIGKPQIERNVLNIYDTGLGLRKKKTLLHVKNKNYFKKWVNVWPDTSQCTLYEWQ